MAIEINARDLDDIGTAVDESLDEVSGGVLVKKLAPGEGAVSGTGTYTPFLRQNATGQNVASQGFNTDDADATANNNAAGLDMSESWTQALRLGDIPVLYLDLSDDGIDNPMAYYELRLDINEENNDGTDSGGAPNRELGLTELQIYTSDRQAVLGDYNALTYEDRALGVDDTGDFHLGFDLDASEDTTIVLSDTNSGSGEDDFIFYLPLAVFDGVAQDSYFTLFSQFGPNPVEGATFEEWRIRTTSKIFGEKFDDDNANGIKDPGEGGLSGFTFYVDANNNNQLDAGEQTAVSDATGAFTFYGLVAGTYTIREVPNGEYVVTTGNAEGDHVVTITTAGENATVQVGNFLPDPDYTIDKAITAVFGGVDVDDPGSTADDAVDDAGDIIYYSITIANVGNVALTNVVVSDLLEGAGYVIGAVTESGTVNSILDVGESWTYAFSYAVTQEDIDTNGGEALPGTGYITNAASASADYDGETIDRGPVEVETPIVYDPALGIDKEFLSVTDGDDTDVSDPTHANGAGDVINYRVTVTNTGNVTLTNVTVVDPLTGQNVLLASLAVGASQSFDTSYTLTQADLDGNGIDLHGDPDGDGDVDNTATADSDQTDSVDDSEVVPVDYLPALAIDKEFLSVTDGDDTDVSDPTHANGAGDVINYRVTVTNTGNVTLTNVTVVDPLTGQNVLLASLAVGASQSFDTSYTLTQADLDGNGIDLHGDPDGDGDVDNTATADSDQTDSVDDSEVVPVDYLPQVDIEKLVSLDGVTYTDEDNPTGPLATIANNPVYFQVVVTNIGNVTLTGLTLDDQLHDYASNTDSPIDYATVNAFVDLNGNGSEEAGEDWASLDTDADGTLDSFVLAVGDTVAVYYDLPFAAGQHTNTVGVTTDQGATDSDAANYYGLVDEGPGVRTPGFWQNPRNGGLYWDGQGDNEPHDGDNFPDGDLLQCVDSDNNGLDPDARGLLIGDYNQNGIRDAGEDVLFITYADALTLIDASNKKGNDGVYMLGRDVVATWLNYLAGNNIDPTSGDAANIANAPRHFIDDAVDWFQEFASDENDSGVDFATFEFDQAIKTNSADWKTAQLDDGIDHSAGALHNALGGYNEDGTINGEYYAGDADSAAFGFALSQVTSSSFVTQHDLLYI